MQAFCWGCMRLWEGIGRHRMGRITSGHCQERAGGFLFHYLGRENRIGWSTQAAVDIGYYGQAGIRRAWVSVPVAALNGASVVLSLSPPLW